MSSLTNAQIIEALRENGHDAEARALEQKTADGQPGAIQTTADFNAAIRRAAGYE